MENAGPQWVPTSLQRLRCFLGASAGLRIRPWAPTGEVLDRFHDALRARRRDDRFWSDLGALVAALLEDRRREAGDLRAAVADGPRREALLAEIRAALAARRRGSGRFRRLARRLSAPALGLLLVAGGAVTAGCYGSHGETDDDAADATDSAGSDETTDARPDAPDARSDDAADSVRDEAADDAAEVRPDDATDGAADDAACDPSTAVFEEIVARCLPGDEEYMVRFRADVLACVAALHESWRAGLTEHYACRPCWEFEDEMDNCLLHGMGSLCADPAAAGEFDLDRFLDNCAILLYVGVRFE